MENRGSSSNLIWDAPSFEVKGKEDDLVVENRGSLLNLICGGLSSKEEDSKGSQNFCLVADQRIN